MNELGKCAGFVVIAELLAYQVLDRFDVMVGRLFYTFYLKKGNFTTFSEEYSHKIRAKSSISLISG